jgi:hypothetical protein
MCTEICGRAMRLCDRGEGGRGEEVEVVRGEQRGRRTGKIIGKMGSS